MIEGYSRALEQPKSFLDVWDTHYLPRHKAFSAFRDAISSAFMPWSLELEPDKEFVGRIESVTLEKGTVGRVRMSPVVAARTNSNVANSSADCVYGNFVLSGELIVEQRGISKVAKQGDIILYDSSVPTLLRERHDILYQDVPFMIPKKILPVKDLEEAFGNVVVPPHDLGRLLWSNLAFLSQNMLSLSRDELNGLFNACVALIPAAVGSKDGEREIKKTHEVLQEMLDFVDRQIATANLSPKAAADRLGISVRYVHKLFAAEGMTFRSYVALRRLEQISKELISPCRKQPISVLAYRWGFSDLSTFSRAFKLRYGVTPSQFRACGGRGLLRRAADRAIRI